MSNSGQILGEFNADEIVDSYVYPIPQEAHVYKYLFPKFKNEVGDVEGFNVKKTLTGFVKTIQEATDSTKSVLFVLGYTTNKDIITKEEASTIKDMFLVGYKERSWEAKKEGRRLFNVFLSKAIDNIGRQQIELLWNKTYNNYAKPDLNKVPIFPSHNYYFGKKSDKRKFELMDAQVEGVRHTLSRENSGLFLHEVGFGKTTSSITTISSMFNTGDANRALFLVPESVYDKFEVEIVGNEEEYGLLPNTNVQLIDNLGAPILKKIKNFTKEELQVIKDFKKFYKEFKVIFKSLKRKRITLEGDPIFTQDSSWAFAYSLIKKELKNSVAEYVNFDVIKQKIDNLQSLYEVVYEDWKELLEEQEKIVRTAQKVIDSPYSSKDEREAEATKSKAESVIEKGAESASARVELKITNYLELVMLSLWDELGIYKPHILEDNTILIGKHTAANRLRPSYDAVFRALCFREGIEKPDVHVSDYDEVKWAELTGLTRSKVKTAGKVVNKHPISLDKLMIDAIIIDEIHNFNNLVKKAGTKGWFHSSTKVPMKIKTTSQGKKGSAATRGQEFYYSLQDYSGRSNKNRYDRKYDSASNKTDPSGTKLSVAALCLDIQYKTKGLTNTILLSATFKSKIQIKRIVSLRKPPY